MSPNVVAKCSQTLAHPPPKKGGSLTQLDNRLRTVVHQSNLQLGLQHLLLPEHQVALILEAAQPLNLGVQLGLGGGGEVKCGVLGQGHQEEHRNLSGSILHAPNYRFPI